MNKNRKHDGAFRLKLLKEHLRGMSINGIAIKYGLSRTLLTRWFDHYQESGVQGLLPKVYTYYTREFKLTAVESYRNKALSLRDCCLRYKIPTESTLLSWVRKYEKSGVDGLTEQRGRPKIMKGNKPLKKKDKPLTRLEELEKENLYLRAENEFLKKLEALTQKKGTVQSKKL